MDFCGVVEVAVDAEAMAAQDMVMDINMPMLLQRSAT